MWNETALSISALALSYTLFANTHYLIPKQSLHSSIRRHPKVRKLNHFVSIDIIEQCKLFQILKAKPETTDDT